MKFEIRFLHPWRMMMSPTHIRWMYVIKGKRDKEERKVLANGFPFSFMFSKLSRLAITLISPVAWLLIQMYSFIEWMHCSFQRSRYILAFSLNSFNINLQINFYDTCWFNNLRSICFVLCLNVWITCYIFSVKFFSWKWKAICFAGEVGVVNRIENLHEYDFIVTLITVSSFVNLP